MSTVRVCPEQKTRTNPLTGGRVRRKINLTHTTWHAAFPGGSAVNATSSFTDPIATSCDRIPEVALALNGAPGKYTLTGLYNGAARSEEITTVANATVKATQAYDSLASFKGPDPVQALTLYQGDLWLDPECRCIATGTATGTISCQLVGETAYAISHVPAYQDWVRAVRQIDRGVGTTLVDAEAIW